MHTTVKVTSEQKYAAWKQAQEQVVEAAVRHAQLHTAETKRALKEAQEAEKRALDEYSKSRLIKYAHVLGQRA